MVAPRAVKSRADSCCDTVATELPEELVTPVVYRDFRSRQSGPNVDPTFNPDFNPPPDREPISASRGLPRRRGKAGVERDPRRSPRGRIPRERGLFFGVVPHEPDARSGGQHRGGRLADADATGPGELPEPLLSSRDSSFFPLDDRGWELEEPPLQELPLTNGHNFGFTTEVRYFFVYQGDEVLTFRGGRRPLGLRRRSPLHGHRRHPRSDHRSDELRRSEIEDSNARPAGDRRSLHRRPQPSGGAASTRSRSSTQSDTSRSRTSS